MLRFEWEGAALLVDNTGEEIALPDFCSREIGDNRWAVEVFNGSRVFRVTPSGWRGEEIPGTRV